MKKVYKLVVTTAPMYAMENGVLYVNPSRGRSERMRVVIPRNMVPEVLRLKHEGTFAGHPGVNRHIYQYRTRILLEGHACRCPELCRTMRRLPDKERRPKSRALPIKTYHAGRTPPTPPAR